MLKELVVSVTNDCLLIVSAGANQIEMGNGQIINLERLTKLERAGKAKMLLSSPGVIVHRHLMDGDGYFGTLLPARISRLLISSHSILLFSAAGKQTTYPTSRWHHGTQGAYFATCERADAPSGLRELQLLQCRLRRRRNELSLHAG